MTKNEVEMDPPASSSGGAHSNNELPKLDPHDNDIQRHLFPYCVVWTPIPLITWILPFVGHMGICDSHGVIYDFAGPYFINRGMMAFGNPAKYWRLHPDQIAYLERIALAATNGQAGNSVISSSGSNTYPLGDPDYKVGTTLYDTGIYQMTRHFTQTQMYDFFCNNCHNFVASCLDQGGQLAARSVVSNGSTDGTDNEPQLRILADANVPAALTQRLRKWSVPKLATYIFFCGHYVSIGSFLSAHLPFIIIVVLIVILATVIPSTT